MPLPLASTKRVVASGTVTAANMRISAVNGAAFADFTAADVLTGKLGHELHVRDSAGAEIIGIIKAAGTGETLDAEISPDAAFDNAGSWTAGTNWVVAGGLATATLSPNAQEVRAGTGALTVLGLYKLVTVVDSITGNLIQRLGGLEGPIFTAAGTKTLYRTNTATSTTFAPGRVNGDASTAVLSSNSLKKVLTPSATGVTITTQKGGTVYNWTAKASGFNYNDSSGYTYTIYKLWSAPIVASGSVTAANSHLDTTTANAFAWLNGVDLSPYQSGKHILSIFDSSGRARIGYISATAPAGETLDAEAITTWTTPGTAGDAYETFTVHANGHDITSAINTTGFGNGPSNLLGTAVGQLNKIVVAYTNTSGQNPSLYTKDTGFGAAKTVNQILTGAHTIYYTTKTADKYTYVENSAASSWASTFTHKRVLDPVSTAAQIVNAKSSAVRGWYYADPNFDPNTAITYTVTYVGD